MWSLNAFVDVYLVKLQFVDYEVIEIFALTQTVNYMIL